MTKYYAISVFYSRNNNFTIRAEIDTENENLDDDDVIDSAIELNLLSDTDAEQVINVEEIDADEYNEKKGING